MSRQKLPGGKWSDILEHVELPAHPPGPIVRSSMPVELEEEPLMPVVLPPVPSNGVAHPVPPLGEPTAKQTAAWQAVVRLGSQIAAARELGMSQGGIQTALAGYMAKMAIKGPLPGKLPANERHGIRVAAAEKIRAEAAAPELQIEHPVQVELQPEPFGATEPADPFDSEPVPDTVLDAFLDAHHAAALRDALYAVERGDVGTTLDPWISASLDWLAEHGPTWNQGQAEKWLVAFTRILDLVYPPGA